VGQFDTKHFLEILFATRHGKKETDYYSKFSITIKFRKMKFDNYFIRPLSAADEQNYFSLVDTNRNRLEDFFAGTVAKNKSIEQTKQFIKDVTEKAEQRIYFPFVIVDTSTKKLAGFVDIKNIDWNIPKAELGCFIDKDYEGKGIGAKALTAITAYCFDELRLHKLLLRTHETNTGSRKIAERNGFQLEGVIRSDYKTTSGVRVDLMYYGLLNNQLQTEYFSNKSPLLFSEKGTMKS
jgi:RimJ/RimL family protein N-acetyltransferase